MGRLVETKSRGYSLDKGGERGLSAEMGNLMEKKRNQEEERRNQARKRSLEGKR